MAQRLLTGNQTDDHMGWTTILWVQFIVDVDDAHVRPDGCFTVHRLAGTSGAHNLTECRNRANRTAGGLTETEEVTRVQTP